LETSDEIWLRSKPNKKNSSIHCYLIRINHPNNSQREANPFTPAAVVCVVS
jgi:hypothetical protein